MKVLTKSLLVASVAALGLSVAACKKDTVPEQQADEMSDASADAMDPSGSASDTMVAPVRPSGEAKDGRAEEKPRK